MVEAVRSIIIEASVLALQLDASFSEERLSIDLARVRAGEWVPVLEGRTEGKWMGAALRSLDGRISTMGVGNTYHDTPLMSRFSYIPSLLRSLHCPLMRVRLLALQPGAAIGTHTDADDETTHREIRLHVPVVTNDGVVFKICDERVWMKPGELWFINVTQPHCLRNEGVDARVHLVIDCEVSDWLMEKLGSPSKTLSSIAPQS